MNSGFTPNINHYQNIPAFEQLAGPSAQDDYTTLRNNNNYNTNNYGFPPFTNVGDTYQNQGPEVQEENFDYQNFRADEQNDQNLSSNGQYNDYFVQNAFQQNIGLNILPPLTHQNIPNEDFTRFQLCSNSNLPNDPNLRPLSTSSSSSVSSLSIDSSQDLAKAVYSPNIPSSNSGDSAYDASSPYNANIIEELFPDRNITVPVTSEDSNDSAQYLPEDDMTVVGTALEVLEDSQKLELCVNEEQKAILFSKIHLNIDNTSRRDIRQSFSETDISDSSSPASCSSNYSPTHSIDSGISWGPSYLDS